LGHRLSKDLGLQLLSVGLALVLWIQASAVQNPVDRFTFDAITVVAEGVPAEMVVASDLRPAKVNITVKCRRRVAERLSASIFVAKVSLEGARAGGADYPVEVEAPGNVEVVEISPAAATVILERAASVKVPVEVRLVGAGADGYTAGLAVAAAVEAVAFGPTSAVGRVVRAVADVNVSAASAEVTEKVGLLAVDSAGLIVAGVSLVPPEVVVTVPVVALPAAESVDVDAALTGSPGEGFAVLGITCEPARVRVRPLPGGSIDFDHIMTMPIDIAGATSDLRVTALLAAPSGVASVSPDTVTVIIEIGATRTLAGIPVEVRNRPPGLTAVADPSTVDVVVRGPRALLDRLVLADVTAFIDAAGRGIGQVKVEVTVSLPGWAGDVQIAAVTPSELVLVIDR
jgi:YbbR domain-containing protein